MKLTRLTLVADYEICDYKIDYLWRLRHRDSKYVGKVRITPVYYLWSRLEDINLGEAKSLLEMTKKGIESCFPKKEWNIQEMVDQKEGGNNYEWKISTRKGDKVNMPVIICYGPSEFDPHPVQFLSDISTSSSELVTTYLRNLMEEGVEADDANKIKLDEILSQKYFDNLFREKWEKEFKKKWAERWTPKLYP